MKIYKILFAIVGVLFMLGGQVEGATYSGSNFSIKQNYEEYCPRIPTGEFTSLDFKTKTGLEWQPVWDYCFQRELYYAVIGIAQSGNINIDTIKTIVLEVIRARLPQYAHISDEGVVRVIYSGNTLTIGCSNLGNLVDFNFVTYSRNSGSWGACNSGTQTRTVMCKGSNGITAGDSNCSSLLKPSTTQSCKTTPSTPTSGGSTPSEPATPPPPPEPVIGSTTETSTTSCVRGQYISGYTENWSNCEFSSVSGNILKCQQTSSYTAKYSNWYGTLKYTYTTIDGVKQEPATSSECVGGTKPSDAISPSSKTETRTLTASTQISVNNTPYANNTDQLGINIMLNGNTNGMSIIRIPTTLTGFLSNIKSNIIDGIGGDALSLNTTPTIYSSVSPNNGILAILNLTSTTPLKTDKGQLNFKIGGNDVKLNNVTLNYLKPFIGSIEVRDISVANDSDLKAREGNISIGTLNKYRLKIESKDNKNILNNSSHISDITISENDFDVLKSKILVYSDEGDEIYIDLVGTKISTGAQLKYQPQNTTHNIEFETRINTKTGITLPSSINDIKPGLQIDKATISYTLDDREVKYYLSPENLGIANGDKIGLNSKVEITTINPLPITKTNLQEFLGVRVIGGIQGGGNSEFTGQKQNISSIASLESRTQIRKNAYTYTNSMTDGQIVNGVKYVDLSLKPAGSKNYKIEENPTYETLVVKNGNVIIDGDLNKNNKVLGIIVLRDGFNVQEDYKTTGNVYVLPNVQKINAIIYADGGLISIKEIKNDQAVLYETDSTERTQNLNKQLYMNGSLFTRNTIGGAVLTNQTNGEYTLPGGGKTTDFNLALQYDLNYTRRGKKGCEQKIEAGKQVCVYNEPFIIKYDSRIQTTPPKLFGN